MFHNIAQNYKAFLLCYLPMVLFFAIIQNFIDKTFLTAIESLLTMSIMFFLCCKGKI